MVRRAADLTQADIADDEPIRLSGAAALAFSDGSMTASRLRRDPAVCKVADVVAIYAEDVAHKHARPQETAARLGRILNFFGEITLAGINRKSCDAYVRQRGVQAAARRELEDLRAAIRHHWEA